MTEFFQFFHFLGAAILVGGELLIALMAIRAQDDDEALSFFVGFLRQIAVFMWVGTGLALVGGAGLAIVGDHGFPVAFVLKLVAFALVIVISVLLGLRIPRVRAAAEQNLQQVRADSNFRVMDLLSRANLVLVLVILVLSVVM